MTIHYSRLILRSPVRYTDQLCAPEYAITREPGDCVYAVLVIEGYRQSVPGDRLEVPVCGVIVAEIEDRSVTEARMREKHEAEAAARRKLAGDLDQHKAATGPAVRGRASVDAAACDLVAARVAAANREGDG